MILGKEFREDQPYWQKHIPEQWKLSRLKHCLSSLESGNREKGGGNISKGIFSIGGEHISWSGKLKLDNPKYVTKQFYDEMKRGKVKQGDILLVKDGATIGKSVYLENSPFKNCAVNEHVFILRSNELFHGKYVYYFVISVYGQDQILMEIRGAAQGGLSSNFANEMVISHPSLLEQQAIANFLDRKTAQIDTLITQKQHLIELLQEYRTSLINQAVTKGLDPNVPMKNSGYEWIGKIPEHWSLKKIKYIVKSKKNAIKTGPFGSQLTNTDMMDDDIKVYNQRSVIDNDFTIGNKFVSIEKFYELHDFEIFSGDILITTRGTIGKCAIFPDFAEKGILHPCLIRLQLDENIILNEYLIWYIQDSVMFKESVSFESNATTIDVIYSGTLKEVIVPIPPIGEQKKIIDYLLNQDIKIQHLNMMLIKQVELLNECRSSLISGAVTGKIDVRNQG
jgi:type I restriction enzyme, S subunit